MSSTLSCTDLSSNPLSPRAENQSSCGAVSRSNGKIFELRDGNPFEKAMRKQKVPTQVQGNKLNTSSIIDLNSQRKREIAIFTLVLTLFLCFTAAAITCGLGLLVVGGISLSLPLIVGLLGALAFICLVASGLSGASLYKLNTGGKRA